MTKKKKNPHLGSTFDSFLKERGVLKEFRAAAIARSGRHSDFHPSLSRGGRPRDAGQRNRALTRMARFGESYFRGSCRG